MRVLVLKGVPAAGNRQHLADYRPQLTLVDAAGELDELGGVRLYDEEDASRIAAPSLRLVGVLDDRDQDATWLENRP